MSINKIANLAYQFSLDVDLLQSVYTIGGQEITDFYPIYTSDWYLSPEDTDSDYQENIFPLILGQ